MKSLNLSILGMLLICISSYSQLIKASYDPAIFNEPFTGRVILYMSKDIKEPKNSFIGLDRFPCFALDVENISPGETITFDDTAVSYPVALSEIERGAYHVQIVWDRNLGGRTVGASPGNMYNASQKIHMTHDIQEVFEIKATELVAPYPDFEETDYVKELEVSSALLSAFHKKDMKLHAAVILPKEYLTEPERKFPVLYEVSGFGGDYHDYSGFNQPNKPLEDEPFIKVMLDGSCALGHSVYANSDNNGPWGDALTTELIPFFEKNYRTNGARLLTGHSSGGWTVLWLQTQYPDVFHGCWSSAPDPVDFRSFQKVNIYEDSNMFYDENGKLRSVATVAGYFQWISTKTFYQMEEVVYRGEQMHSFNAVFSERGADGLPMSICDAKTGEINKEVFMHWKQYDIASNLKNDWETLKADLDGKVRVSVGEQDNFLLNYAVHLLDEQMQELQASFEFGYYAGDHFTVFYLPEYQQAGYAFLKQKYVEWQDENGKK